MSEYKRQIPFYERSAIYQLFVSLGLILSLGTVLLTASYGAGALIFDARLEILENPSAAMNVNEINFLRFMLFSQDITVFIIPAIILLSKLKPVQYKGFMDMSMPEFKDVGLVIILAFCIFPVTAFTGHLNSELHLPDQFSGLEKWIVEKEDNASGLFSAVMNTEGFGALIINLLMIAVLPAIGEEFVFRGIFQKIFQRLFRSGHIAIWVTAFIFSFVHFQFYGFVPRFILGLVFGYLFFWSGTLWLPVIAHFVNNAVPTLEIFSKGWDQVNLIKEIPVWKQLIGLPVPVLISIAILFYFRRKSKRNSISDNSSEIPL